MINCGISDDIGDIVKSMDFPVTAYVDHLSQIQLNLPTDKSSYYPGDTLTFNHQILDKLGNTINTNFRSELSINIETTAFIAFL